MLVRGSAALRWLMDPHFCGSAPSETPSFSHFPSTFQRIVPAEVGNYGCAIR
jgi:hypothetical protein